jgi:hypothetical protein
VPLFALVVLPIVVTLPIALPSPLPCPGIVEGSTKRRRTVKAHRHAYAADRVLSVASTTRHLQMKTRSGVPPNSPYDISTPGVFSLFGTGTRDGAMAGVLGDEVGNWHSRISKLAGTGWAYGPIESII